MMQGPRQRIKFFMDCFDFIGKEISTKRSDITFSFYYTQSRWRFNFLSDFLEVRQKAKSGELDKYDVVHINNWFNFLLVRYRRPGQVWIAESHAFHLGLDFWGATADSSLPLKMFGAVFCYPLHLLLRRSIKKFDLYYVAIPNLLEKAKEVRPDATWLPNPVSGSPVTRKLGKMEGRPAIFYPTRLHRMKSPEFGFVIFDKILERYPEAKLHLIRYHPNHSQYAHYRSLLKRYEQYIVWHDFVPREQLPAFYASFDIVLGAFGKGLLNLVELEAMTVGAPVVSYDRYEFIKRELDELPSFAVELLEDEKKRKAYAREGRAYVARAHNPATVGKTYLKNVRGKLEALKSSPSRRR